MASRHNKRAAAAVTPSMGACLYIALAHAYLFVLPQISARNLAITARAELRRSPPAQLDADAEVQTSVNSRLNDNARLVAFERVVLVRTRLLRIFPIINTACHTHTYPVIALCCVSSSYSTRMACTLNLSWKMWIQVWISCKLRQIARSYMCPVRACRWWHCADRCPMPCQYWRRWTMTRPPHSHWRWSFASDGGWRTSWLWFAVPVPIRSWTGMVLALHCILGISRE